MAIKFESKRINSKIQNNTVYFLDKNLNIKGINSSTLKKHHYQIKQLIDTNKNDIKDFFSFNVSPLQKIIIIRTFDDKNTINYNEKLGAKFYEYLNSNSIYKVSFLEPNIDLISQNNSSFIYDFILGFLIKSYHFNKYKTKKNLKVFSLNLGIHFKHNFFKRNSKYKSILDGINLTKDLVSEPGNILHPDEYVNRLKKLKSFGLKVTIFDKKKLKKLGMNALLGVGQGSIRGSYLGVIEWKGSSKKQKPLAFVGKGVCFDTGGISLKPAKFMEDMTYDMAGSAVVVGLMKTLALR